MRNPLIAIFFSLFILFTVGAQPSLAQTPDPTPITVNPNKVADTFIQMSKSVMKFLRYFREEIEAPLNDYLFLVALAVFSLLACAAFLRLLNESDGGLSIPQILRFVMRFGVLAFVMTVVLLTMDKMLLVGNYIAYGAETHGSQEWKDSWLGKLARDQQETFQASYERFMGCLFIVKINGTPTDLTDPGDGTVTILGVTKDQGLKIISDSDKADPTSLFQWLSMGRFAVEGANLVNTFLPSLILIFMRLFAPFAIAAAIDKGLAARLTWQWIWGTFAITIVMPIICQLLRIGAYLAGNMALQVGDPQPIYTWDFATMTMLKTGPGDPVMLVRVGFVIMVVMALMLLSAIVISYQITYGKVYETGSQLVAGYMFGAAATAIGVKSAAMAAAVNRQAENTQIQGQASAESHTLKGQKESADLRDTGGAVAARAASRAQAWQTSKSAESSSVAAIERAISGDARTVRDAEAADRRVKTEAEGRVEATDVEAQNAANQQRSGMTGTIVDTLKGADRKLDQWLEGTPFGGREVLRDQAWRDGEMSKRSKGGWDGPVTNSWGAPRDYNGDGIKNEGHTGVDIGWNKGERVGSAQGGKVLFAGRDGGYGNRVVIQHPDGQVSSYSHLDSIGVAAGQEVKRGQAVGVVGNTGNSDGAHLHFETGTLRGGTDSHGAPNMVKVNPQSTDLRPVRLGKGVPAVNPNAAMATQTGQAMREATRLRETAAVNGSGGYTQDISDSSRVAKDDEVGIADRLAKRESTIAWTGHTMRVQGINSQEGMNKEANNRMFDYGMKAMQERRDSMLDAASWRERGSLIAAGGSIFAQQVGRLNETFRF